jgi:hypothetical protein
MNVYRVTWSAVNGWFGSNRVEAANPLAAMHVVYDTESHLTSQAPSITVEFVGTVDR